ncbi:hypothetical protein BC628DRAFT_512455 [Trametes gibbosa]|nr:hypothetical protein BC628DRAFT_512455 [Trametes gibbosa]
MQWVRGRSVRRSSGVSSGAGSCARPVSRRPPRFTGVRAKRASGERAGGEWHPCRPGPSPAGRDESELTNRCGVRRGFSRARDEGPSLRKYSVCSKSGVRECVQIRRPGEGGTLAVWMRSTGEVQMRIGGRGSCGAANSSLRAGPVVIRSPVGGPLLPFARRRSRTGHMLPRRRWAVGPVLGVRACERAVVGE